MKNEVCIIVIGIFVFFFLHEIKKPFQCTDCSNFISFNEQILKK
jgi:hypothetical protein